MIYLIIYMLDIWNALSTTLFIFALGSGFRAIYLTDCAKSWELEEDNYVKRIKKYCYLFLGLITLWVFLPSKEGIGRLVAVKGVEILYTEVAKDPLAQDTIKVLRYQLQKYVDENLPSVEPKEEKKNGETKEIH